MTQRQGLATEILAIGNELLIGDVQDSNTHWLCKRITGLGGHVTRATLVRDEPAAIADALHGARTRQAGVIFTSGGLGPTRDDLTLEAIAGALGRGCLESPQAMEMVQATYLRLAATGLVADAALTPERRKMACVPAGARLLGNPVGAAPGVLLQEGVTTIICLPGVPAELKGIFECSLSVILAELYGEAYYTERSVRVDCGDESAFAPVVNQVAQAHPDVYVKSRAKPYGPGVQLTVTLSARGESRPGVEAWLAAAQADLCAGLRELGWGFEEWA